jgi:hypothetical protein
MAIMRQADIHPEKQNTTPYKSKNLSCLQERLVFFIFLELNLPRA